MLSYIFDLIVVIFICLLLLFFVIVPLFSLLINWLSKKYQTAREKRQRKLLSKYSKQDEEKYKKLSDEYHQLWQKKETLESEKYVLEQKVESLQFKNKNLRRDNKHLQEECDEASRQSCHTLYEEELEKYKLDLFQFAKEFFSQAYISENSTFRAITGSYETSDELEAQEKRISSALLDSGLSILSLDELSFSVSGLDGKVYKTTLDSCTCEDFTYRRHPCKHMYRVAAELGALFHLSLLSKDKYIDYLSQKKELYDEKEAFHKSRQAFDKRARQKEALLKQKQQSFPYLADLFAELDKLEAEEAENFLRKKSRPANAKADEVASNGKKIVRLRRENKQLRYQLMYLKNTLPWLEEYITLPPDDAYELVSSSESNGSKDEYHVYRDWLSPEEWEKLSIQEKYQLALDRYKNKCINGSPEKTAWQAGIEYERYVGYLYEQDGYRIAYIGATDGLGDLGRDLIAKKDSETLIIQCKRWHTKKVIHEKHIFQLYGTLTKYSFDHPDEVCSGVFVTTTSLSDIAKEAAEYLNIAIRSELVYTADYPMIKGNISGHNGEKIFHLPMDQQYDRITIEKEIGENYFDTVEEALSAGFRRAKKWRSNKE